MITMSQAGDTPYSIAARVLGSPDESYAEAIYQANLTSFANEVMNNCGIYAANRAVWLPGVSHIDDDTELRNHIIHKLDFIPSWGRSNLAKLQRSKVDINHMIGSAKAIRKHNRINYQEGQGIATSLGAKAAVETIHRGAERITRQGEVFSGKMRELNGSLKNLLKTRQEGDHFATTTARDSFRASYQETVETLNHDAKIFAARTSKKTAKYFMSPKHMEMVARKKGILISDLDDVAVVSKIARYGEWGARGCFVFSAAIGTDEVYETYKHHGDVWGKVGEVLVEIGTAIAAGAICFVLITPVGWVAVATAAIVEGVGIAAASNFMGTKVGKPLGDDAHNVYDWANHNLGKWL
ncbi:MAG: hypothetical protein KAS93_02440 [Gammaproteobacteria bacterium]|nr:hypothetical protein [Gammaproteobacteria bacterium]